LTKFWFQLIDTGTNKEDAS